MSSSDTNQKRTGKGRARATAAWEWFKEAAWLQVLLIVGVVVALVVSIPYIISAISNAVNDKTSDFYQSHRITYDEYEKMVNGEDDNRTKGAVGNGSYDYGKSDSKNGFVVMFYKSNCDNCTTMQPHIEDWYDNFNSKYAENKVLFYAIDVSWDDDNADDAKNNEGKQSLYDNQYITLEQQQEVINNVRDVYLRDNNPQNSAVTETTLNTNIITATGGSTIPTPCFLTYTRDNSKTGKYELTQVTFGAIGSLSLSSNEDVAKIMLDIYQFQYVSGSRTSSN